MNYSGNCQTPNQENPPETAELSLAGTLQSIANLRPREGLRAPLKLQRIRGSYRLMTVLDEQFCGINS